MQVLSIKEQPNGSAILELEMTKEEQNIFIEIGVLTALKEQIKEFEREIDANNLCTPVPE
jgi:hypothetical protein